MMITELLGRQWIQKMENTKKRPWLMEWYLWQKMGLEIWWSCWLEGNPLATNGCLRRI